jgi:AAA family ATP:ADP antiporter
MGPANLLLITIVFLEVGLFAARRAAATTTTRTDWAEPSSSQRSPYVVGLALNVICFTITSACVYLEQAKIVEASFADRAERTALFARIDLLVNLVGLGVQTLLTGRIIHWLGVGGASATLPLVTLGGFIALWTRPTLGVLMTFQVARRAVDYAVARPCREVMYAEVRPQGRMGTKALIDTAVYRAGDALGAWAYGLFAMLPGSFGTAMMIVPLTIAWMGLNLGLGRSGLAKKTTTTKV